MTPSRLPLTLVLLFLAALAVFAWYFLRDEPGDHFGSSPGADPDDRPSLLEPRRRSGPSGPAGGEEAERAVVEVDRDHRGRLEGRIEGPTGFDLGGVRIILEKAWTSSDDDPEFRRETRPDAQGGYAFDGLDSRLEYAITLEAPGRRVQPRRNTTVRFGAEVPTFLVTPVLACAPRLLDPSGFDAASVELGAFRFDMRQLEREGLELISDVRLHGLPDEDIALAGDGVGLYVVPRERSSRSYVSLTVDLVAPGYEPQKATFGLVELNAGSPIPRPVHALRPRSETRPVTLAISYDDGGLPLGRSDLQIGRHVGWQFAETYRLRGFDLGDLPAAVFRLEPGLHALDLRDARLRRSFEIGEGEGPLRIDLRIPRGGDIVIELPPEGAPYRLAAPARGSTFNAPDAFELPVREYLDLDPGLWSFAVVDRRGRRVEGMVELARGQRHVWRPFAD